MQYPRYKDISESHDKMDFRFESVGPKGVYKIIVQFSLLYNDDIFNLAFGAADNDGSFDDTIVLNNNDRNKILATVANIAMIFIGYYPNASIYFTGSTHARTRLYRRVINFAMPELQKDFEVQGLNINDEDIIIERFEPYKDYFAFLITKK